MFCENCGFDLGDRQYCPKCGTKAYESSSEKSEEKSIEVNPATPKSADNNVSVVENKQPTEGNESKSGNHLIFSVILVILVAVVFGTGGFFVGKKVNKTDDSYDDTAYDDYEYEEAETEDEEYSEDYEDVDYTEAAGAFDADAVAKKIKVTELGNYTSSYGNDYYVIYSAKNTSKYDVKIEIQWFAYDNKKTIVETATNSSYCLGAGCECAFKFDFEEKPVTYDYKISVSESSHKDMTKQIDISYNISGEKVIIQATNNGKTDIEDLEVRVVFFSNGKAVDYDYTYIEDVDDYLKAGKTEVGQVESDSNFDSVKIYLVD